MRLATTYKTFTKIPVSWLFGIRHTYICTRWPPLALSLVSLSRSFLWQWRRHQHPPSRLSEPANNAGDDNDLAFFISFPSVDICFLHLAHPTPSFSHSGLGALEESDAGGWRSIVSKSSDEKFYPLAEEDDNETIAFNSVYRDTMREEAEELWGTFRLWLAGCLSADLRRCQF